MSALDLRGCAVSGATPSALDAFERALAASQRWQRGADAHVEAALEQAPDFVMAHVLEAYLLLGSRDPRRVEAARPVLARAARLPANERERMHVAAIAAVLADDYERAKSVLGAVLRLHPRDALALQIAHALDYLTGDVRIARRVAAVLPAWSCELPGYGAVLAMHAFGLEERGQYGRAERTALAALELDATNARAHHVMAHVFEMTDRAEAGERWMAEHIAGWALDTVVATHCWWHVALFRLAQQRPDRALALYDERVRATSSTDVGDLLDAASLLWRIELCGGEPAARWFELADAWSPHIDDAFCSFTDVHAMLAFVGARDWHRARLLELALIRRHSLPTRYGETTRMLGLPACRALIAFGRGDDALAIGLLARLPARAHRLGGSYAQRDVLSLTLRSAVERARRMTRRRSPVPMPALAFATSA